MKKCSFLLCAVLVLISTSQADRYVTSRKAPPRPKSPVVQILETSYVIQKSQQTLDSVELILQQAHDLAETSTFCALSFLQREQLDIQFQELLTLVDPMVEMSEFQGQSLLAADGRDIVIRFGRDTLHFKAVDITLAGLNLEGASLPAYLMVGPILQEPTHPDNRLPVDPNVFRELMESRRTDPNLIIPIRIPIVELPGIPDLPDLDDVPPVQIPTVSSYEIRKETFYKTQAAIRKIKQLKLQFAEYHNTACKHLPYLERDDNAEVRLGLEIVHASRATAEDIRAMLEWVSALINESISGSYSPIQRSIIHIELEQSLLGCTAAERVYYGMGIIDGQNHLTVNTGRHTFEFEGFDLTTAGLGLDGDLHVDTVENAQSALPYIASAIGSVQQAVNALTEYEQTLSELLNGRQVTGPRQARPTRPQPSQVRQPVQHPTARPARHEVR